MRVLIVLAASVASTAAAEIRWQHLSTTNGALPLPRPSRQQTAAFIADDIDGDGDLDVLSKPYNWDAPRIDVWLNTARRRCVER